MPKYGFAGATLLAGAMTMATAAAAQVTPVDRSPRLPRDTPPPAKPTKPPLRVRVALGPQINPGFPGDDQMRLNPMFTLSRARGDAPFTFGAPGDGNAATLLRTGRSEFGPIVRLEGRRQANDLVNGLPGVKRTVELGGVAQTWLNDHIRLRADVRKGIGGHEGWISQIGGDYVYRDGDRLVASLGPRMMFSNRRYQRAWFGISPATAATTGLAPYDPGSGLHSVGAVSRVIYAFSPTWGVQLQGSYGRLVGDAGDSPFIRDGGSRNQLMLGIGATYTFTLGR